MIGISIDLVTPHKYLPSGGAQEMAVTKYTRTFTDFSLAGLSRDIVLTNLTAKQAVCGVIIRPTVNFAGGAITSYRISVGIGTGGSNGQILASPFECGQGVFDDTGQESFGIMYLGDFANPWPVYARAAAVGGNLNTATAGSVDIYLFTIDLP